MFAGGRRVDMAGLDGGKTCRKDGTGMSGGVEAKTSETQCRMVWAARRRGVRC